MFFSFSFLVSLRHQKGHRLFLHMMQGLKFTIKHLGVGSATRTMSPLLFRARSAKKDSRDSSLAGSSAHDNSDKATRKGGRTECKGHPSF